jgi:hypothetical protein
MFGFKLRKLFQKGKAPGTYRLGGWIDPRARAGGLVGRHLLLLPEIETRLSRL